MASRKCKFCKKVFVKTKPLQMVCSFDCAIEYGIQQKLKQEANFKRVERKKTREAIERTKPAKELFNECKTLAQKYSRIRDSNDGCISCDKDRNWWGQWHGSHFMPAGNNKAVALNLLNIHKACSECNNFKSGNLIAYQDKLIKKIGIEKVEWLKSQKQPHKFDVDYLRKYKRVIGKCLKRLERTRDVAQR